ncbi:MAG: hypothetical protein ACRDJP_14055, partial [Actinomycetota bacterium]
WLLLAPRDYLSTFVKLGVVLALALVVALLPGNAEDRAVGTDFDLDTNVSAGVGGAGGTGGGATGTQPGAEGGSATGDVSGGGEVAGGGGGDAGGGGATGGGGGDGGGTGGGAAPAGSGEVQFGKGPCRSDGRQAGISIWMPPCVEWTGTDNGGSTFRGVTKDKVVIVRWMGQLDPATEAILRGYKLADDGATIKRAYEMLFRYSNQHYETYGREVVFVDMQAGGASENDEAMKADALKIATEIKPFAVIEGNAAAGIPPVLGRELAQRGVICLCTTSLSTEFYQELPPLIFSSLPTSTEYAAHSAEYIGKKLAGKNAVFAGDELNPTQGFKSKPRKFGLIYLEGARGRADPEGKRSRDAFVREFAKYGIKFAAEVGYLYDPGRNQNEVTNMIASMKGAGVTTVVAAWDPLSPILITKEATRQQYFPEWFVTGTGLSDTTTAGRLYDQLQWTHAFGISPLWVTWDDVTDSAGYREYHHGRGPGGQRGEEGNLINIYRARIETLFRGIHMAGPNLTNESFARGQLAYPPTGGTPLAPLYFFTRELPTEIKDYTEVWYSGTATGPDERGEQGPGMMMKTDGGKRYKLGQWTKGESLAFKEAGAVAVTDGSKAHPAHEQDGHTHDPNQRCLRCQ